MGDYEGPAVIGAIGLPEPMHWSILHREREDGTPCTNIVRIWEPWDAKECRLCPRCVVGKYGKAMRADGSEIPKEEWEHVDCWVEAAGHLTREEARMHRFDPEAGDVLIVPSGLPNPTPKLPLGWGEDDEPWIREWGQTGRSVTPT